MQNARGSAADTPDAARAAVLAQGGRWLRAAGAELGGSPAGVPSCCCGMVLECWHAVLAQGGRRVRATPRRVRCPADWRRLCVEPVEQGVGSLVYVVALT